MLPKTLPNLFTMSSLLCLLWVTGCTRERRTVHSEQEDIAAITAVSKARADAFNQSNAAAIAVHFAEDALLMAPDKPTLKGKAAVQNYYQHIFDEYETSLKSYYDEVKVSGDLAYGRGFAEVALNPKRGGPALKSTAKYINIMRRDSDGKWTTTHDIWNGNEPPGKQ
jgi:uncharacterized protein (TIGR02246 family)